MGLLRIRMLKDPGNHSPAGAAVLIDQFEIPALKKHLSLTPAVVGTRDP
jgi:hypothetical protein